MNIIYKSTNKINNKCYIGQTVNFKNRKYRHEYDSTKKSTVYFTRAIAKYGINNFEWEILVECPVEDLNAQEIYWIKYWESFGKKGYNLTISGKSSSGYKQTKEHIQNNINTRLGKKQSDKTKEKMRIAQTGKKLSDKTKNKISLAKRNKTLYSFKHKNGDIELNITIYDLCIKYKLNRKYINRLVSGNIKFANKWYLI